MTTPPVSGKSSSARSVRVRMYRVGLGDCFLITFPGPRHLVLDCGSAGVLAGRDAPAHAQLAAAVADIARETAGRISVVVASHRRLEHVNGFALEARRWNGIEVAEVWMPWTEDPADGEARVLRDRLDLIAARIAEDEGEFTRTLALNNTSSLGAFDVLHDGFSGTPLRRYLIPRFEELVTQALPGVHVRVLGPVRNEVIVRRNAVESSFALSTAERSNREHSPFDQSWRLSGADARTLFRGEIRERNPVTELDLAPQTNEELAFWLDKSVANTSLVLLVRCGRARLLLPGDAQWDSWLPILGHEDLRAELSQVSFYKASQHGGHNGTPEKLVRVLGKVTTAISTTGNSWPEIPYAPLQRLLAKHGKVVRSDRGSNGSRRPWVDFHIPC